MSWKVNYAELKIRADKINRAWDGGYSPDLIPGQSAIGWVEDSSLSRILVRAGNSCGEVYRQLVVSTRSGRIEAGDG